MKLKSQRDFWSGLLFVVAGLAFSWAATGYGFGSSAQPGPGLLPFGLGLLLALLGGLILFKSLAIESEAGEPFGRIAWRPLLLIPAAAVLFGYALPRLGLFITVPALAWIGLLAAGPVRWRLAVPVAVSLTVGCWLVFIWGLKLPLALWPMGLLR